MLVMNRIIFIGRFFPRNLSETVIKDSNSKIEMSNHNFEMSIINGLSLQENVDVHCFTIPAVYSYPYNNNRLYTSRESYVQDEVTIDSIPFLNLPIVKEIWGTIGLALRLIKKIRRYSGERVDAIVNTPDIRILCGLAIARVFLSKRITQTVIIPDLPSMLMKMDTSINPVKRMIMKSLNRIAMKLTSRSNGLVLLTEAMSEFFDLPKTYIVMEGLVSEQLINRDYIYNSNDREIILYAGTIRKIFGIMNLIEAFRKIKRDDVELWICGSGDARPDIERISKEDSRIRYWGMVSSKEALDMQRKATILVNPRTSEGEYTKYSFPSKTIEYMISGKDVIINRLPGIPDEYYDFVHVPEDESVDALADCISGVIDMDKDSRASLTENAKEFIVNNKNSKVQVAKILQMIKMY